MKCVGCEVLTVVSRVRGDRDVRTRRWNMVHAFPTFRFLRCGLDDFRFWRESLTVRSRGVLICIHFMTFTLQHGTLILDDRYIHEHTDTVLYRILLSYLERVGGTRSIRSIHIIN